MTHTSSRGAECGLKARRKKSRADLADMETVLDVLAERATRLTEAIFADTPNCLQIVSKQPSKTLCLSPKTSCATT
ncbi:hypothetical protein [Microcoleus sp. herbarium14]|uniref:hypothetical protein n=1 Tax=Microcoleus sp. herbarium14 TaxID=3055439 RepID=UPI002FD15684